MQTKVLFFSIALLLTSASAWKHPLKMTFSKLTIASDGFVELETRFFLDDLSMHIQRLYFLREVDFSELNSNGTQALQEYLTEHYYFKQSDEKIDLQINAVSFSKNNLALIVNLTTTQALDPDKEAFLVNTLLCDAFSNQKHVIKYFGKPYQFGCGYPEVRLIPAVGVTE